MTKEEWLASAMADDRVVVELLMRLKQAKASPLAAAAAVNHAVIPLRWGIRQRRSRPARCDAVSVRKEADSAKNARCSPTTPLSWSGGGGSASPSAAGDGYEETSRLSNSSVAAGSRSKILATDETSNVSTKRLRRKKTFAELKEEENVLLKERLCLKKEIATLRTTFKEQSIRNESLKKIKIDLNLNSSKNLCSPSQDSDEDNSGRARDRLPSSLEQVSPMSPDDNPTSDPCNDNKAAFPQDSSFVLPDLNMMPSEDDSLNEFLYGTS